MVNTNLDDYDKMFIYFDQLSYPDKLIYFHKHFNIIPFLFPGFNTEISWYNNQPQLTLLIENFYKETPRKFIAEKTFIKDDHTIKFNVQPVSQKQKILYNRFIVHVFLELHKLSENEIEGGLQMENYPIEFLTSQINSIISTRGWMKDLIDKFKAKINLPVQFLQVLSCGMNFYYSGEQVAIQQSRKFVELYLFSYGFFLADHLAKLQRMLQKNVWLERETEYANKSSNSHYNPEPF
jgi:hypothetical protein